MASKNRPVQSLRKTVLISLSAASLLIASAAPSSLNPAASAAATAYGEAYVTLSSFSGVAGAITVSGGGYEPGQQVTVFPGTGPAPAGAAVATVNADNSFGPLTVQVPLNSPQGVVPITAVGIGGLTDSVVSTNAYFVTPYTPTLDVTASSHTPGSTVVVSGSGYAPNEVVTLALGAATATATASATGAFTGGQITVPRIAPGNILLTGTGASTNAAAVAYFYVDAFFPSVYPSAYFLLPGESLSFSGQGFMPGETVDVAERNGAPIASFAVPASAAFEALSPYAIPLEWAGSTRELVLTGRDSGGISAVTFTVGQFFPNVVPSVFYVTPGQPVGFSGTGFAPGETVDMFVGTETTPFASLVTDATGAFAAGAAYTAPYKSDGSAQFRFVGRSTNAVGSIGISVGTLSPQLQPSTYFVKAGQPMTAAVSGFAPGEVVALTGAGIAAEAITDADGVAQIGPFTVPFETIESLTLTATGSVSAGTATVTIGLGAYMPTASASAYYLLPGDLLTLTGTDFAPGETVNLIQAEAVLGTATADEVGAVAIPALPVPFGSAGALSYELRGVSSKGVAVITITVGAYFATAAADNYYVQPGSTFNVSGSGFAPGEAVSALVGTVAVETVADAFGVVAPLPVVMPFLATGETAVKVTLTGQKTKAVGETAITAAPFAPNVSPSTYYDRPGTPITFTATGFVPGETVTATLGGASVESAVAGPDGGFSLAGIALPFTGAADYVFTGGTSGGTSTITIGLAEFYPGVQLSSYYGPGGAPITLTGAGFAGGESVALTFGGVSVGSATADALGAFSLPVTAPFGAPGAKAVTGVGSISGATAESGYTQAVVYSSVELANYVLSPGIAVQFTGAGFFPGEPVHVRTDRSAGANVHQFSATAAGTISDNGYVIPAGTTEGPLSLTIAGTQSFTEQTIVAYVGAG